VLEIGSGTGQHAVYFGEHLPHLSWQTSDIDSCHPGINAWLEAAQLPNIFQPLSLDVSSNRWPNTGFDGVFSANTTHIMSWPEVIDMFNGIGSILKQGGVFCLYGPFNYDGHYTSESNERFDSWLKERDPLSGIRNFEDLDTLAQSNGMAFRHDHEMPVNNRLLVWAR
jgi:cyclopropane fatty-acyl-phospholipid synthase-like methyltransferase